MTLLLPEITTFVDPGLVGGAVHDGRWLVEVRQRDVGPYLVVDGTSQLFVQHEDAMRALFLATRICRGFLLYREPQLQPWAASWRTGHLLRPVEVNAVDVLAGLPFPEGAQVMLVAGYGGAITEPAVAALHAARPDVRLYDARAAGDDDLRALLVASGGGALAFHAPLPAARTLAIEPGRDAEVVVHAERVSLDPRAPIPRALVEVDRLRVDAVTAHVDEPAFLVTATARVAQASWTVTAYHLARRATAALPSDAQLAGVPERAIAPLPELRPLPAERYHPAAVTGELVFSLGGRDERVPLVPALRIENAAGAFELQIIDGEVAVTARAGTVRFLGNHVRPRMIRTRLSGNDVPGVAIVNPGVMIELAADEAIALGEVRVRVELGRITLAGIPETFLEHGVARTPCLLRVDGEPLELRVFERAGELRRNGRPMVILGRIAGDTLDPSQLWWLAELAAGRVLEVRSRDAVPLAVTRVIDTPGGAVFTSLRGSVRFDLAANTVTIDAVETMSDDR